ncbi:MAG TPA: GSCFA domain-containing protein [Chitinivibrionales bacterium]|nr:GSCFA domain-containing protein [Chitinivibrionales bacterium]
MTGDPLFRTVVDVPESSSGIAHGQNILCLGSCFAETIGGRLVENRFNACVNPAGPLFNSLSMAACLRRLFDARPYAEDDIFPADGLWHSWDHHSRFSSAAKEDCLKGINKRFSAGTESLKGLDVLILTFGTAFVYRLKESGRVVANCHKQPQERFVRELLSIRDIADEWTKLFRELQRHHPKARFIVTISPVRHLRDDPHDNLISKSTLACAVHELEKAIPQLYYFPAYEIMMDELRDYRFYEKDMAHPNEVAVDFIWDKFVNACVEKRSKEFVKDYEPVRAAMGHRVMKGGKEAKNFIEINLEKIKELEKKYPGFRFEGEKEYFGRLIS